jgi:hypothetical protein
MQSSNQAQRVNKFVKEPFKKQQINSPVTELPSPKGGVKIPIKKIPTTKDIDIGFESTPLAAGRARQFQNKQ